MDRDMLQRHLEQAERHVAQGERHILSTSNIATAYVESWRSKAGLSWRFIHF